MLQLRCNSVLGLLASPHSGSQLTWSSVTQASDLKQGSGGAMALTSLANISVSDCTVIGNSAGSSGGGMYLTGLDGAVITVDNCT